MWGVDQEHSQEMGTILYIELSLLSCRSLQGTSQAIMVTNVGSPCHRLGGTYDSNPEVILTCSSLQLLTHATAHHLPAYLLPYCLLTKCYVSLIIVSYVNPNFAILNLRLVNLVTIWGTNEANIFSSAALSDHGPQTGSHFLFRCHL